MIQPKEDSLSKRYRYKLLANFIGLIISFITGSLVPRGLGPKAYGDYNFLSNFITQIMSFFDLGTSICFYTKLSQRPDESSLVTFYWFFAGFSSLAVMGFLLLTTSFSSYQNIWLGQKTIYIYLATIFVISGWFVQILDKMNDAYSLTVSMERIKIIQKVVGLVMITVLFFLNILTLLNYFVIQIIIVGALIVGFILIIKRSGKLLNYKWKLSRDESMKYIKEFYKYSHPLIVYALIGITVGILERWMLQYFSGSVEQGFFGLSYQIGTICFLFTGAMTPLLMREFTIAFNNNDREKIAYLFRRYVPLLYSIAAYFSCFIALQADKVIHIMGGVKYKGAFMAVTIMAFYPVFQTYGQLSSSVFYATGQTVSYRNIGIISNLLWLPVTYFLIAPHDKMGLNTGATGLAIKMVLQQIYGINVQLYFNAKKMNLRFWYYLWQQLVSLLSLLIIAIIVSMAIDHILHGNNNAILSFIFAGILYSLLVVIVTFYRPEIFGLNKEDIKYVIQYGKEIYRSRFLSI